MCIHIYIYIYIYIYTYIFIYIYMYMYICTCVYMNIYIYMYMCIYIYAYIYIYITHVYTYNYIYIYTYLFVHLSLVLYIDKSQFRKQVLFASQHGEVGEVSEVLYIHHLLGWLSDTGWWLGHPSEKYESQLGWLFPIYGKIKNGNQTTNQLLAVPWGWCSVFFSERPHTKTGINLKKLEFWYPGSIRELWTISCRKKVT